MTDQPDLKARVEELTWDLTVVETPAHQGVGYLVALCRRSKGLLSDLLSRITDLEAERDEANAALEQFHEHRGWTANHVAQRLYDEKQAAESRLALAEKVVEAGRPGDLLARSQSLAERAPLGHWTNGKDGELLWELCEFVRALSAALTAYEENTSDTSARNVPAREGSSVARAEVAASTGVKTDSAEGH